MEEFHWDEENNLRCTWWSENTDSAGIHFQNREFVVPDPLETARIVLPTYYFAECDYIEATSLLSASNEAFFETDIIGIIAASCVIVCIFALAVITFAKAEHNRAVASIESANRLTEEIEDMKEKRKTEIDGQHSEKERGLITSELAKIEADDEMNKMFIGMKLNASEIQMKEIIGRGAFGKVSRGIY